MIGSRGTQSFSGADNVVQLLAALNDPKGVKARLAELEKATKAYEKTRDEANQRLHAQGEHEKALNKREASIHESEEKLKAREEEFNQREAGFKAGHEARATSLAEREQLLTEDKTGLATKVNDFSRYRERQIADIQAKATDANRLHQAAVVDRQVAAEEKSALLERVLSFEKILSSMETALAALKK